MSDQVAFSVDLEPNKDGSLDGIRDAITWFDEVVDRGTVFTTYRIADELPGLITELAETHEIGLMSLKKSLFIRNNSCRFGFEIQHEYLN